MKLNKSERRYVSRLTVYVDGAEALIDMMRYDRCCPDTEEDSRKIWRLMSGQDQPADHIITLARYAGANLPATEGRWMSFGCLVLDERSHKQTPPDKAEMLEMAAFLQSQRRAVRP